MKRLLVLLAVGGLLAGCRAGLGPAPTEEGPRLTEEAAQAPVVGLTPAPEPDWEGMLAGLQPEDIRNILGDILSGSITPETLASLVREAMKSPVEHLEKENGDDRVWSVQLTLGEDWQEGRVTLFAGLEEDLVGVSLPGKMLWLEDGELYRLIRTSMDTPPDIDGAAYERYGEFIRAYYDRDLARRSQGAEEGLPGDPGWTAGRWELEVLRLAAEREEMGVQVYDLRVVHYMDPPELAPIESPEAPMWTAALLSTAGTGKTPIWRWWRGSRWGCFTSPGNWI